MKTKPKCPHCEMKSSVVQTTIYMIGDKGHWNVKAWLCECCASIFLRKSDLEEMQLKWDVKK